MKPVRSLLLLPALLIAGVAILASTATAATRPDDRQGMLGIGSQAPSPAAAHPDSRPGIRGVEVPAATGAAVRPDDRAGVLGVGSQPISPAAAHPDNRTGIRGVTPAAAEPGGIDWTTIGIGVGAGVAALLLIAAAVLTMRHGGHRPHRPALGH